MSVGRRLAPWRSNRMRHCVVYQPTKVAQNHSAQRGLQKRQVEKRLLYGLIRRASEPGFRYLGSPDDPFKIAR